MNKYSLYPCFEHWCSDGSIYFIGDPHFSDDEMKYLRKNYIGDDEQVKRINSKIGKKDTIIFLGDIGNVDFIKKIRGYKVLIKGNHDAGSANYRRKVRVINNITSGEVDNLDNRIYRAQMFSYWQEKAIEAKCGQASSLSDVRIEDNHLFDEVYEGPLMISEKIILSHEPIRNINWALNIHGHCHGTDAPIDDYHLNLCAEHIDYTPVCLKHIVESGAVGKIDSIHRLTIDRATENKKKKQKSK